MTKELEPLLSELILVVTRMLKTLEPLLNDAVQEELDKKVKL